MSIPRRFLLTGGLLAAIAGVHLALVRPWYLAWGTSETERAATYAGDELVPSGGTAVTRAVTIAAPRDRVWAWVAQTGQDRGGFFSYDLLENLVGCEMPRGDTLLPGRQAWSIGDTLWMYPREKAGGIGHMVLRALDPGRSLVFRGRAPGAGAAEPEDGIWGFHLASLDTTTTRLVARGRGSATRSFGGIMFERLFFDPVHFMMERRMLLGIRALAEGRPRGRATNDAMVILFLFSGALTLLAIVRCIRAPRVGLAAAALVACAFLVQVLTLGQPPLALAIALSALTASAVASTWPRRTPSGDRAV